MNKPEATANVIAFNATKSEYESTMSAINTSYGKVNSYLGRDNAERQLAKIADNAEFLADVLTNVIKAQALGKELARMIEAGLEEEALEFEMATYRFHEYNRAVQANVQLDAVAFAKAKRDAVNNSQTAANRRGGNYDNFYSLLNSYELANGLTREEALAQVEAFIADNGVRYLISKKVFVTKSIAA